MDVVVAVGVGELLRRIVGDFGKDEGGEGRGLGRGRRGALGQDGAVVCYARTVVASTRSAPIKPVTYLGRYPTQVGRYVCIGHANKQFGRGLGTYYSNGVAGVDDDAMVPCRWFASRVICRVRWMDSEVDLAKK